MVQPARSGSVWSTTEIDLIVADYFAMLEMDLAGQAYVKAGRNLELQRLTGRSRGAIEYKHQNISAVLKRLGEPWIPGYKPMTNIQNALIDGVERRLDQTGGRVLPPLASEREIAEADALFVGPAPPRHEQDQVETPALTRLVRKFDPAARDERNRDLGRRGEQRVLRSEVFRLKDAGRSDLASRIRWVSETEGDGAGFDILSFNLAGEERYLEVKTTAGHERTPFYLSRNEKRFSEQQSGGFRICRVYDFARNPKAFRLKPPLEDHLYLKAASYQATFR